MKGDKKERNKHSNKNLKKEVKAFIEEEKLHQKKEHKITLLKQKERRKERAQKIKKIKGIKRAEGSRIANWLTLDNAATIYPSIREENWDFVYRVSAVFKQQVQADVLQKALNDLKPRFPSFFVKLKSGLFWNYFEEHNKLLKIEEEKFFPCSRFNKGSNEHLIRVLYFNKRVSVECFHALADGRSTLKFLNSLIKRYIELLGTKIVEEEGCLNYLDKPKPEELADSFFEYSNNEKKLKHKEVKAYAISGTQEEYGVINSTTLTLSVSEIKKIAKTYNCKMFELILAVLGCAILKRVPNNTKKPIKLSVPIDLRRFFESESLRNFSGYLNVEIPTDKTLDLTKIIEIVKNNMEKITKDLMQSFINSNTAIQKNYLIKIVPLFIKNLIISQCFKVWGESYQTLAVSNLGLNHVPHEFDNYIKNFEFNVGRPKYNAKSMGIVSFRDNLSITISSKIKENTTEKDFIKMLASLDLQIEIDHNRRDIYE